MTNVSFEQLKLLNAACGDLSEQIAWHGQCLTKDDWRHLIAATILGARSVRGIDLGDGIPGIIYLSRSSLDLSKEQGTEAIELAFSIGDDPGSQDLQSPPVRWGPAVTKARYLIKEPKP